MYTVAKQMVSFSLEKICPEIIPVVLVEASRVEVISKEISSMSPFVAFISLFVNFGCKIRMRQEILQSPFWGIYEGGNPFAEMGIYLNFGTVLCKSIVCSDLFFMP